MNEKLEIMVGRDYTFKRMVEMGVSRIGILNNGTYEFRDKKFKYVGIKRSETIYEILGKYQIDSNINLNIRNSSKGIKD